MTLRRRSLAVGMALAVAVATPGAVAQAPGPVFPKEAKSLGFFSALELGIWKPKGDGPFPAVILIHTCGGVREQIRYWRKEAVQRGYVAFVMDSFTARGSRGCVPGPAVSIVSGLRDALAGAEHLATFPFVDKTRISLVGMSWGAMVGLLAASPAGVARAGATLPATPLHAVVSLYPKCGPNRLGELPAPDLATATLVLMGEEDNETPALECLPLLQALKERNAPVAWHLFKNATHCWDCSDQHNQRWSPPWAGGRQVVYLYDSKITDESAERTFTFLARPPVPAGKP